MIEPIKMNKLIDDVKYNLARKLYVWHMSNNTDYDTISDDRKAHYRQLARELLTLVDPLFDEIENILIHASAEYELIQKNQGHGDLGKLINEALSLIPTPPDEPKWYEGLFKLEIPEGMTKDEYMQGVRERLDANLKPIFDAIEKAQENNNDTT